MIDGGDHEIFFNSKENNEKRKESEEKRLASILISMNEDENKEFHLEVLLHRIALDRKQANGKEIESWEYKKKFLGKKECRLTPRNKALFLAFLDKFKTHIKSFSKYNSKEAKVQAELNKRDSIISNILSKTMELEKKDSKRC